MLIFPILLQPKNCRLRKVESALVEPMTARLDLEDAVEGGAAGEQVAESGRAELRALTFGGAVWDAFRENANCGDPPG